MYVLIYINSCELKTWKGTLYWLQWLRISNIWLHYNMDGRTCESSIKGPSIVKVLSNESISNCTWTRIIYSVRFLFFIKRSSTSDSRRSTLIYHANVSFRQSYLVLFPTHTIKANFIYGRSGMQILRFT